MDETLNKTKGKAYVYFRDKVPDGAKSRECSYTIYQISIIYSMLSSYEFMQNQNISKYKYSVSGFVYVQLFVCSITV